MGHSSNYPARMLKLDRLRNLFTLGSLGITPRLALAFAAVAVLAAASYLIVENGVTIVEAVTHADSKVADARRASLESAEMRVLASQLVLALGRFDKAAREHVETRSSASSARYSGARSALRKLTGEFAAKHVRVTGEAPHALQAALQEHEASAEALVQAAQDRRARLASYSTTFARMDERLQASLDGAWKIMGRVVARQSLLNLTADLDEIQSRFATRDAPGTAGDGQTRLAGAEQSFSATLLQNEAALRRSQGAEWFHGMRNDFETLAAARVSLEQVEKRKALLTQKYTHETDGLIGTLSNVLPRASSEDLASLPAAALAEEAEILRRVAPAHSASRSVVAWISGIVLAVLAYICVVTILSVVRPVRRLLDATTRLAKGGDVAPLAAGGIRELDTLSQAFNAMAGQLAAARAANREAQQSLEAKVEERTRQLQELAERDPLTGLANRRQLFAALNASIERAAVTKLLVGTFFLDIDNFKTLNDSMGHAFGDRVLTAIARRLEVTALTFGFAARLGGDEFMLVHEGATKIDEIVASGNRIVDAFQEPIRIDGRELIVSVSVGASIFPDHEQDAEALLRAADAALFDAKAAGRSRMTLFTPELLVKASTKFRTEQRLRRAIEKGEFELFYQPEINVQSLEVTAVEALIRWRMPDGSYELPGDFLAVAEESGLILEINDWVLRTAIETASNWHHGPWPEARVAVNVSPRQFLDYRFVEKLEVLLEEFRLPARCIELELTESVLQTGPATITTLTRLRALGFAIALDDFGTGYSSIASIEQLPLTRIKLDRSLIARMDISTRSASIARATIGLCNELGLAVTAEGVERLAQFTALLNFPSMSLQGYLVALPVPRDELLASLKRAPVHCQELVLLSRTVALEGKGPGANEPKFSDAAPFAAPASVPTRSRPPHRP